MTIELDHAIVSARNAVRAAQRLAQILGVPWAEHGIGPFSPVHVNSGLTLDFIDDPADFPIQHFAFRVGEAEFDAILGRLRDLGIATKSTPHGPVDGRVSIEGGLRRLYWNEPDGHQWEMFSNPG
jgi:hypothetical protein